MAAASKILYRLVLWASHVVTLSPEVVANTCDVTYLYQWMGSRQLELVRV